MENISKKVINDFAQNSLRESIEAGALNPIFDDYGNIFGFKYSLEDIIEAAVEDFGFKLEFYDKENSVELYAMLEREVREKLDGEALEDLAAEIAFEFRDDAKEARYRQSDLERATAGGAWL